MELVGELRLVRVVVVLDLNVGENTIKYNLIQDGVLLVRSLLVAVLVFH